ncbi:MAG: sulfotransferase [Flavobacteriaceae bacterium]|nr:sulfotransferase [Flavobacteriaceae bacterium]
MEKKANLFLVGAMKAGTTSFVDVLSQHSQIYVPPIKEPHYFVDEMPIELYEPSRFFDLEKYFDKEFPKSLHISHLKTQAQYEKLYSLSGDEEYRLDASTAYLHAPGVANRIFKYNPDATIIILTRDPMARAFSHYKMDIGKGRVNQSFEDLIRAELIQNDANNLSWHSYLGMSKYSNAIENFREYFEKVLVISFEELKANPKRILGELSGHLQITGFQFDELEHKNVARKPKFQGLFYLLKKLGLKDYFSRIFSHTFKQWLFRATSTEEGFEIQLTKETLEKVNQFFEVHSRI